MSKYKEFGYEDKSSLDCFISENLNIKNTLSKYNSKEKKWDTDKVRIATFNCLGLERFAKKTLLKKRLKYICEEFNMRNLDIICLQEVSNIVLEYFLNSKIIQKSYYISNSSIDWKFGGEQVCLILSKIKPVTSYLYYLKGEHYYGLSVIDLGSIVVASIYLQAGSSEGGLKNLSSYSKCRVKHLKASINKITEISKSRQFFILGDFNFHLDGPNLEYEDLKNYNLYDIYRIKNPNKDGFTEDTNRNEMRFNFKSYKKTVRYDGIFTNKKTKIIDCKLFGTEPIFTITKETFNKITEKDPTVHENNKINWYLSDHFGIYCDVIIE